MGDMGDIYRDMNEHSKLIREKRRVLAPRVLKKEGVLFSIHNNGAHIIIGPRKIDFWPGTGMWKVRGTDHKGFGLGKLIRFINKKEREQ